MKDETFIIIAVGAIIIFALLWMARHIHTLHLRYQKTIKKENSRQATFPMRMQAYERLAILMERLTPEELLLRYNKQASTVEELQIMLLSAVRSEYEHNAAQQIYVSPALWEMISNARHTLLTLINQSAVDLAPDAPSYQLAKRIIDHTTALSSPPTSHVLASIRTEAHAVLSLN
jgi:hypothetical protein